MGDQWFSGSKSRHGAGEAHRDERRPETPGGRCLHARPAGRPHPDSGPEWQDGGGDDADAVDADPVDADADAVDAATADSPTPIPMPHRPTFCAESMHDCYWHATCMIEDSHPRGEWGWDARRPSNVPPRESESHRSHSPLVSHES